MSIGGIARKTTNFLFNIINFDFVRWHSYEHDNWDRLDSLLNSILSQKGLLGPWTNSLIVAIGDKRLDTADGTIWVALVAHTTPATGTFAADRTANPSRWALDALPDLSVSTAKLQDAAVTPAKLFDLNTGMLLGRTSAGTGDVEQVPLTDITASLAPLFHGQCRLVLDGSSLRLNPHNGNKLIINAKACSIPSGGVALAPTGLQAPVATTNRAITSNTATLTHAALPAPIPIGARIGVKGVGGTAAYNGSFVVTGSTTTTTSYSLTAANEATVADTGGTIYVVYYIYAVDSNNDNIVDLLEASTTGHSRDASNGVETKTGDATRSLVGMASPIAGPAWADSSSQRFVRSWFNRRAQRLSTSFTAQRSTASLSFVEINAEIRSEFLIWTDELAEAMIVGSFNNSSTGLSYVSMAYDGITAESLVLTNAGAATFVPAGYTNLKEGLAEGYHVATVVGKVSANTSSYGRTGEHIQLAIKVH